jgi:hypothetical protein
MLMGFAIHLAAVSRRPHRVPGALGRIDIAAGDQPGAKSASTIPPNPNTVQLILLIV